MSMVMEFLGLSPAGLNGIPAEDPAKEEAARRTGELVMDLVRHDVRPSCFVTRAGARERDRLGRRDRRLDQRRAPPPRDRPRVRDPARHRRVRGDRRPDAAHRRHAPGRPLHRDGHVRGGRRRRSSCASCSSAPDCSTATRRRSTAGRSPSRGRGCRDARPGGRRPDRDAAQADRRAGDPPRHAGARGLRREARRPRAARSTAVRPACSIRGRLL